MKALKNLFSYIAIILLVSLLFIGIAKIYQARYNQVNGQKSTSIKVGK